MTFVDTAKLEVIERKPGWFGRYFQSPHMTFAHYDFTQGSSVHEHFHPQEEVWQVIEFEVSTAREPTVGTVVVAGLKQGPATARHRAAEACRTSDSRTLVTSTGRATARVGPLCRTRRTAALILSS